MNKLVDAFKSQAYVKRIQELERFIDDNEELKKKIKELKMQQKKMVNAKEFHQEKQYEAYQKEYEKLYQELMDFPFMEEYLDLLFIAHQDLSQVAFLIEKKINENL